MSREETFKPIGIPDWPDSSDSSTNKEWWSNRYLGEYRRQQNIFLDRRNREKKNCSDQVSDDLTYWIPTDE